MARRTADILSARRRRNTSVSSAFGNQPLFIDHCSLIIKRSADEYGNTLIFTAPGADGLWFTDDDVQSDYGANEIIYCGYRFDPESQLYYVRNRTYHPVLGRWVQGDPIGYSGGINLYGYVGGNPVETLDAMGLWWTYWNNPLTNLIGAGIYKWIYGGRGDRLPDGTRRQIGITQIGIPSLGHNATDREGPFL